MLVPQRFDVGMDVRIEVVGAGEVVGSRRGLSALLEDAVGSGASIGFLPPLAVGEAEAYWDGVAGALRDGARILLVAWDAAGAVVGAAQLGLETRPNGRHRAEVMKVMVRTGARRRGIGRALMVAVEAEARRRGRTTLVLDTRAGDPSERLYTGAGWRRAGVIPAYARSADGRLDPSAFYYKLLEGGGT